MSAWRIKDAECSCDTVFDRALGGEPQIVMRHGVPSLVVITYAEYANAHKPASVFETLTSCPCDLTELLSDGSQSLAWGNLVGESIRDGRTRPAIDAQIAATAIRHGMTLVTRNVRDFESIPVRVVNPF